MATEIVYLLGAGASYGTREKDEKGNDSPGKIIRGIPIVNELENAIKFLKRYRSSPEMLSNAQKILFASLDRLEENCKNYPTIDTYAKQLFVTKRKNEYEQLKKDLTVFFTLQQDFQKRDLRYDGFIASLIDEEGNLPNNIKILSWNYDCQFELAYSGYIKEQERSISRSQTELKISNKLFPDGIGDDFGIIKLNGTAISMNRERGKLLEQYFAPTMPKEEFCGRLFDNNEHNALSFAWEKDESTEFFLKNIVNNIKNARTLVVIGYSFPYVNRKIDRMLLRCMENLRTVYIQDVQPELIQENLFATLSYNQTVENPVECKPFKNLNQFVIPSELR